MPQRTAREIVKITFVPQTTRSKAKVLIRDKDGKRRTLRLASNRDIRISFDPYHIGVWVDGEWRVGGAVKAHKGKKLDW